MNLYYSSEYKNKIINLLLKNEDFIKVVNPSESKCDELDVIDVMIGGQWIIDGQKYEEQGYIFDYNFVNNTTLDEKTFIFVETDIDTVRQNTFTDFNLYVFIFTDKNLVRLSNSSVPTVKQIKDMGYFASTYGNRIDILCDIVDRTLNGSDKLIGLGDVEPAQRNYVTLYCPNSNYYGKCLKYHITNYNDGGDECGY